MAKGWDVRLDGAVRLVALVNAGDSFAFEPRIVVQSGPQDKLGVGERSLLFQGTKWGRFVLGYRQGLPNVLIGYAPNSFTFAGAEYGPATVGHAGEIQPLSGPQEGGRGQVKHGDLWYPVRTRSSTRVLAPPLYRLSACPSSAPAGPLEAR